MTIKMKRRRSKYSMQAKSSQVKRKKEWSKANQQQIKDQQIITQKYMHTYMGAYMKMIMMYENG